MKTQQEGTKIMEVIQMGRRQGKTRELARRLRADPDAICVVASRDQAMVMTQGYRVPERQVMASSDIRNASLPSSRGWSHLHGRHISAIYVDDVDRVLGVMFGQIPKAVTVTQPKNTTQELPLLERVTAAIEQSDGAGATLSVYRKAARAALKAISSHVREEAAQGAGREWDAVAGELDEAAQS